MSEVLVGSAYGLMQLRYEQFTQGASIVEQQILRLQQLTKNPILLNVGSGGGVGAGAARLPSTAPSAAPSVDADAAAYTRLQRAQAALEAQQARLARAQGDAARAAALEEAAQQRLTSELQAQAGVTTQSIAIERQLTTVQQQSARAAQQAAAQQQQATRQSRSGVSDLGSALGQLRTLAGGVGIGLGVQQIVSSGIDAGGAALQLRETKNSLRAVSGDIATYTQTLGAARQQQLLFGGSLQENIEGLSGLTITARSSGASLQTLIGLSQRLAVLDPSQGAGGARIALNEALSGDPTSLARRYEIPRAALAKLRDTTLPVEERLKVIDSFLSKVGITAESVAGKVDQDALAFRRLGQELGDARLKAGDELATAFSRSATGLARLVGVINQNPQAIAELKALLSGKGAVDTTDLDAAAREVAANRARQQLAPLEGRQRLAGSAGIRDEGIHLAREQLTELNLAGGAAAEQAARLTQAFTDGTIKIGPYRAGLAALTSELQVGGDVEGLRAQRLAGLGNAQDAVTQSIRTQTDAMNQSAQASVLDAAAKDTQQAKTALAAAQAKQATDAFLALNPKIDESGVLAVLAAKGIDEETARLAILRLQAIGATADLNLLNLAQSNLANQKAVNTVVATNRFFGRESGRGGGSDAAAESNAFVGALQKQQQEQQKLLDSEIALAGAKKNTAREIELLRQKQAQYAKGTAEFNTIEAQILGIQAAGGKARVSAAESTALQLNTVEQNSGLQLLKTQRENLERLRDQQEDFDVKRSRSREDFERDRNRLLAQGQRGQAARLSETFARDQRREQEDFDRQKRRTLRNNAEATGDIGARTDLRTQQIGDRAALRGVPVSGARVPDLGQAPPSLSGAAGGGAGGSVLTVRVQIAPTSVQIDGHQIVEITWPEIEQRVDTSLADEFNQLGVVVSPSGGQTAVAGT